MRQTTHLGSFAVFLISGASLLMTLPASGQQAPRAPRPQSTAGARPVQGDGAANEKLKQTANVVALPQASRQQPASNQPASAAGPQNAQMAKALDKILTDWERHTATLERMEGQFRLQKYEQVFETETRAFGNFWYEKPDKGRMDLLAPNLSKLPTNQSGKPIGSYKSPNGTPYVVKPHVPETWVCTGTVIRQFNHGDGQTERTYSEINIPEQFQGEAIRNSPLPFLFGLKKEEAKRRYQLSLGPIRNTPATKDGKSAPLIHIIAFPLEERDAKEWSKAEILLYSDTFLPYSIQTIDPAGTGETVYFFVKCVPNGSTWFKKDPFDVSTRGYKKLDSRDLEPQPAGGAEEGKTPLFKPKPKVLPRDNDRDG